MKYRIRYSPAAQDDADTIWDDLAASLGDEDRAEAYVEGIADEIASVRDYPKSGSPLYYGHLFTGFYWVLYRNHKAFYRIVDDWIEVARILHAKSDYMKVLFEDEPEFFGDPYE